MATEKVDSKGQRRQRRPQAKRTVRRLRDMTAEEWKAKMARLREIAGDAFRDVDVDDYVNSFRR